MSSYDNQKTDSTCYGIAGGTHAIGVGSTTYDQDTGAYDQHIDYDIDGARLHHREHMDAAGRYYRRDVDRNTNGSDVRVQKDYVNPNTGTSFHRETEYDVKDKGGSVCAPSVSGSS